MMITENFKDINMEIYTMTTDDDKRCDEILDEETKHSVDGMYL